MNSHYCDKGQPFCKLEKRKSADDDMWWMGEKNTNRIIHCASQPDRSRKLSFWEYSRTIEAKAFSGEQTLTDIIDLS